MNIVKWISLILLLLSFTVILLYFKEYKIDLIIKPYCPGGWWHTSEFWAHCAYPPISIAKYTIMYFLYSLFSILLIELLSPKPKLLAVYGLFIALIVYPAWLLTSKFSWVALFCMLSVILMAASYTLYLKLKLHTEKIYNR